MHDREAHLKKTGINGVLVLNKHIGPVTRVEVEFLNTPTFLRLKMTNKKNKCKICNSIDKLHIHHLKPRRCGGTNKIENLVVLCSKCHRKEEYKLIKNENLTGEKRFKL